MSKVLANLAGKDCQVVASLAGNDFVKIHLHYLPFAKKGIRLISHIIDIVI